MRRRDFLRTLAAAASAAASHRVFPQDAAPSSRAAVVIGINKSGDLPVLNAAVSGARSVARWLEAEGFEVKEFLDERGPVKADPIYSAIEAFVDRGTLQQLVVYFSGHGFNVGYSEHWFLSKAPRNPNESISLAESVALARASAIPNVVFISDACRSTSESLGVQRAHGSLIFPSGRFTHGGGVEIDRFFAALPGEYALELPVDESTAIYEGIFTHVFLSAYNRPQLMKSVHGIPVVPNRSLKEYLVRNVGRIAEAKSIKLRQLPHSIVESDDTVYIGRYKEPQEPVAPPSQPMATIADLATVELARAGVLPTDRDPGYLSTTQLSSVAESTGFNNAISDITEATRPQGRVPDQFETQTGLLVSGARLEVAFAIPREIGPEVLEAGDGTGRPAILRSRQVPGSLILRFADGSGTVVANLPGFIGTLVVRDGLVVEVGYAPSRNSWRWDDSYVSRANDLRAIVAASARFGVFRIEGNREERRTAASTLADRIRVLKGIDPTLGLYAAYAYAEAGLIDQVRSVNDIMRNDLGTRVFDVAMLSGELSGQPWDPGEASPFCPMLNQGWGLLRVTGVVMPRPLEAARDHLRPGLWTTFERNGMSILNEEFG